MSTHVIFIFYPRRNLSCTDDADTLAAGGDFRVGIALIDDLLGLRDYLAIDDASIKVQAQEMVILAKNESNSCKAIGVLLTRIDNFPVCASSGSVVGLGGFAVRLIGNFLFVSCHSLVDLFQCFGYVY